MTASIEYPILNSPYDQPDQHFQIDPGGPTGDVRDGRRPSESFIPIAFTRKGKKGSDASEQVTIDFDATGERRERHELINDLRRKVGPDTRKIAVKVIKDYGDEVMKVFEV